jgi:hypothetical protein
MIILFGWMRALSYLRKGLNVVGVHVALAAFGKRYVNCREDDRGRFADVLCQGRSTQPSAQVVKAKKIRCARRPPWVDTNCFRLGAV